MNRDLNARPSGTMTSKGTARKFGVRVARARRLAVERLERRDLLSGLPATDSPALTPTFSASPRFLPNVGQTHPSALFTSQFSDYSIFVKESGVTLFLRDIAATADPYCVEARDYAVSLELVDSRPSAHPIGENRLDARTNFLVGDDPAKWRHDVPAYATIRQDDVYPGIDLVYYASQEGRFEYDFAVDPGADPSAIAWRIAGADHVALDRDGRLALTVGDHDFVFDSPRLYQEGAGARVAIDGRYRLSDDGAVSFEVSSYDKQLPLVIDPQLAFARYLGGAGPTTDAGRESANAVAVDSQGNLYVTGITSSLDFPLRVGAYDAVLDPGDNDVFVAKYDPTGTIQLYSTLLGGTTSNEWGFGIAVGAGGNAYVTGYTRASDFPTTPGAFQTRKSNDADVFVAKLDPTGSNLVYSTFIGASSYEEANAIAVDAAGVAYVVGHTYSRDFPRANSMDAGPLGGFDGFLAVVDPLGAHLQYSALFGGQDYEEAFAVALSDGGAAYVTGVVQSADFPTSSALQANYGGGASDAFLTKFDLASRRLDWSTFLGGAGADVGRGVAVGPAGVVVVGTTDSPNFPLANAWQPQWAGDVDMFAASIAPAGDALVASTYFGGAGIDTARGVALDSSGRPFLVGDSTSANLPLRAPVQSRFGGAQDAVLIEFSADLGQLVMSTFLGGSDVDFGNALAVDGGDNVVVVGETRSPDFPTVNHDASHFGGGRTDAFVTKIIPSDEPIVLGVLPPRTSNVGMVDVQIAGGNFPLGATTARLITANAPDLVATEGEVIDPTRIRARFDMFGAPAGPRDLVVTFADGSTRTTAAVFSVWEGLIPWDVAADGEIVLPGETSEWRFYGRAGQAVTIVADPTAASSPPLGFIDVRLVDPSGQELVVGHNAEFGEVVTLAATTLPSDGNYRIRVRAADGHDATGRYSLSLHSVTPDDSDLDLNQTVTGRIETPYSVDRWSFWADSGSPVRFRLVNSSASNLAFDLSGPNGWRGFQGLAADSPLLVLPSTGRYTLTARASGDQAGAYAIRIDEASVVELVAGEPVEAAFAGSGQARVFHLQLDGSTPLRIALDSRSPDAQFELYARFELPPTRAEYDFRFSHAAAADQAILIPRARAGDLFILVYGAYVPTTSTFELLADQSDLLLSDVAPRVLSAADDTLLLTGAGFGEDVQVELIGADGSRFAAGPPLINSPTQLRAAVPIQTLVPGSYHVRVARPGGAADLLLNALTVATGGVPRLETRVVVPDELGRHAVGTLFVEYANVGTAPMRAPLLTLTGSDGAFLTLDESRLTQGFWTSAIPDGFSDRIQFLASGASAGRLLPGEKRSVPIYFGGLRQPWNLEDMEVRFDLGAVLADDPTPLDRELLETALAPVSDSPDARAVLADLIADQAGGAWGGYVRLLDDKAAYLGEIGQSVIDVAALWAFEVRQANGLLPLGQLAAAVDLSVPAPGLDLSFSRQFGARITDRYEPTDALGNVVVGRGWSTNWDLATHRLPDGTVIVVAPGGERRFQPDSRDVATFFASTGDSGVLSRFGDEYTLRETNGAVLTFRVYRTDIVTAPNPQAGPHEFGALSSIADQYGNRIDAQYADERLARLTHSSGASIEIIRDTRGRVAELRSSDGRTVHYGYDADDHLIEVHGDGGSAIQYSYATGVSAALEHALTSITAPDGSHSFLGYDERGRLASTARDGGQQRFDLTYDSNGIVSVADPLGGVAEIAFDHNGLPVRAKDPLGRTTQFAIDDQFRLTKMIDPSGAARVINHADGDVIQWTDQLGAVTTADFDEFGRLESLASDRGVLVQSTFDDVRRRVTSTFADGTSEVRELDGQGNVVTVTSRGGRTTQMSYDSAGRIARQEFPDGSAVELTYDDQGRLIAALDATGQTRLSYRDEQLEEVTYPNGRWIHYDFDGFGQRTRLSDSTGHVVNYSYDSGRLARVTDGADRLVVAYSYDLAGRVRREDKGNGTYTTYTYNAAGEVVTIAHHAPDGGVNSQFVYLRDDLGRVVSMETSDGDWSFQYDATGQLIDTAFLTESPAISNQQRSYQYDDRGNRVTAVENAVTTTYVTNSVDQYVAVDGTPRAYDADGQLVRVGLGDTATTYEYDARGQLITVFSPFGTRAFEYDVFGHRTATTVNGERTEYLVDPTGLGDVIAEFNGAGEVAARYVHGIGLEAREDVDGASFFDFDLNGSTSGITGVNGAYLNRYVYEPFGAVLAKSEAIPNPFQFVGQFGVTSSGDDLYQMGARQYRASDGRFQSFDPSGTRGGNNLLAYAANNPIGRIDPTGNEYLDIGGAVSFGPIPLGITAGVMIDGAGVRVYGGGGFVSPGWSVSVQDSADTASSGWAVGLSGNWPFGRSFGVGPSGQKGWAFGSGPFSETGLAVGTPGVALTGYYVSDVLSWPEAPGGMPSGGLPGGPFPGLPPFGLPPMPLPPVAFPPGGPGGPGGFGGGSSGVSGATDPNQIVGPAGVGAERYVSINSPLSYRVEFENDARATAPAQHVDVVQQLDAQLDWSSFSWTEFGFGDRVLSVPAGTYAYRTVLSVNDGVRSFQVNVDLRFDRATGLAKARFESIDPATKLPPVVTSGFLPPEDGTGRGMGHIGYVVRPRSDLASGAALRAVALITFDGSGETIATNQRDPHDATAGIDPTREARVTIDAARPTTVLAPLAPLTKTSTFIVSWTGDDDVDGSGLDRIDVYVAEDDGAFSLWTTTSGEGSAVFNGRMGHGYAFRTEAFDRVGAAQASTTVEQIFVNPSRWTNALNPLDVSGDLQVAAIDALLTINLLNKFGALELTRLEPAESQIPQEFFFDTNGDGFVAAIDALLVINRLNAPGATPPTNQGDGEDAREGEAGDNFAPLFDSLGDEFGGARDRVFAELDRDSLATNATFPNTHLPADACLVAPVASDAADSPRPRRRDVTSNAAFASPVMASLGLD